MKLIVDRIEENTVVCETEETGFVTINLIDLPDGVHEGSILIFENGSYFVDLNEEQQRREKLFALQEDIFDE